MRTDALSAEVRRTVEDLTEGTSDGPIELLFVGQHSVWLVLAVDRIESEDALIEVFQAVQSLPRVETLYVERAESPSTRRGPNTH